jgi:hypothetical protein
LGDLKKLINLEFYGVVVVWLVRERERMGVFWFLFAEVNEGGK